MSSRIRFYNPREASPEVLEAMLVGREGIVQEVLDDLKRQACSASRQHWLIRGPRGIGKTHLVGIIYHRLLRDPGLSASYIPIWLAETEAYSAYSAGILLQQIAERLTEEISEEDPRGSAELSVKSQGIELSGDDPALFEELCEVLKGEAQKRGKILVILMENLDALLTSFPGKRGTQEVRRLRSLLTQDKEFLFLSTTPTRYLKDLSDPKQPLFGHLKERTLQSLTEEEVGKLLQRLGDVTGQPEKLSLNDPDADGRTRLRVLHRLTGGNPRAVVMAFSVLSGTPGIQAMVEEMSALLDAQTAYFEARLAQLAPRERTVVTAMSLASENLKLQEIARLTRLPERSLSTQVKRLVEQGYVAPVAGEGGKGTIYEVSDGLFRLWYQYRKGRKVLQPIVRFLALWHPVQALEQALLHLRSAEPKQLAVLEHDVLKVTTVQLEEALVFARSEEGRLAREQLWEECQTELSRDESLHAFKEFLISALTNRYPIRARKAESKLRALQKILKEGGVDYPAPIALFSMAIIRNSRGEKGALLVYREIILGLVNSKEPSPTVIKALAYAAALLVLAELEEEEIQKAEAETLRLLKAFLAFPAQDFFICLMISISAFPPKRARELTHILASRQIETAILLEYVLDIIEASTPKKGDGSERSSSARARRVLAKVPPEVRAAVQEISKPVLLLRPYILKRPKHSPPPDR